MEGVSLWLLITMTVASCAAAMHITYNVARQRRSGGGEAKQGDIVAARSVELQLGMGLSLVLPFVLLTGIVPSATVRSMLNFTFCWVTPFKLLLLFHANFFLDSPSAWTLSRFSHFLLAFLLPVRMKAIKSGPASNFSMLFARLSSLIIRFCVLLCQLSFYDAVPLPLSHLSHCIMLYLTLDLPHRLASICLLVGFGIETHPTFHSPWLASSPSDFWGQRWDLTANALLRHTIYNPIVNMLTSPSLQVSIKEIKDDANSTSTELDLKLLKMPMSVIAPVASDRASPVSYVQGIVRVEPHDKLLENDMSKKKSIQGMMCAPTKPPSLAARLVGVNATFFISGLIHEVLYFCVTQGQAPTWEVTAFFVVQGMATSMEILLRRAGRCRGNKIFRRMPRPLKVALTIAFMYTSATWLFFPQLVRGGVYMKCAQEHKAITQAVRSALIQL